MPAAGADFVASKIEAVASNPEVWAKTAFILSFDENDGIFDHVPPPTPPAGTKDEFVDGLPIGGGFRVPCIIVSPWTVGGWVATERFDHTSVLQFLEKVTGVKEPNISDWRRQTFGDLTSAFRFTSAQLRPDCRARSTSSSERNGKRRRSPDRPSPVRIRSHPFRSPASGARYRRPQAPASSEATA
jgi:phospholipase C